MGSMKRIYWIIGAMAVFFGAIGIIYFLSRNKINSPPAGNNQQNTNSASASDEIAGFVGGKSIRFYNLGVSNDNIGSLYVPVSGYDSNNNPQFLDNFPIIFSSKKGDIGYSDFWKVFYVVFLEEAKEDYVKSEVEIKSKKLETKNSDLIVNQPQVEGDKQINNILAVSGWANDARVSSLFFAGKVSLDPANPDKVAKNKVYIINNTDKADLKGSAIIFSKSPEDIEYSPLKQLVNVKTPLNFDVGKIKSEDDILKNKLQLIQTDVIMNLPVNQNTEQLSSGLQTNSNNSQNIAANNMNDSTIEELKEQTEALSFLQNSSLAAEARSDIPRTTEIDEQSWYQKFFPGRSLYVISIVNYSFDPSYLEIPLNSSVLWVNKDEQSHIILNEENLFGSTPIAKNGGFLVDFISIGQFLYHNGTMPGLSGTIVVK